MDRWNVHGRTKDLALVGHGASDLDDYVRDAAGEQGRIVHADAEREKASTTGRITSASPSRVCRRSILVPALTISASRRTMVRGCVTTGRSTGTREDLMVFFAVGYRVVQADKVPEWKPGNEFRAKREAMLKSAI